MKITHLNERLTLIANISVVAGIVFLGLELNQNTGVMKAQAQADLTANRISYAVRMMDPVNADLVVKAGGEGVLNASEQLRYEGLLRTLFLSWESEYYQFQNGLLKNVPDTAWRGTYRAFPQMDEYWSTYKTSLTPEFAAFLDQVVTEEE